MARVGRPWSISGAFRAKGLTRSRGNAGEQHERQHMPAEPRHEAADRAESDQRLRDADQLKHDAERPRSDFAIRIAERIVGFGVLEAFDIECRSFVEDPKADAVLQRVAEQLARGAVDRLQQRRENRNADLQCEEHRERR